MKTIGFIDYYLDEWHANNLPGWIRESAWKDRVEIGWAWAQKDREGGLSSEAWCSEHGVRLARSLEEVVEKSDYLIVLSPDNPERHEELADLALRAGKPLYVDKTFAPDVAAAKRMFSLAEKHDTPMFSSSALRFAEELRPMRAEGRAADVVFAATGGSGTFEVYAVHQLEMIVSLMGTGARRVMQCGGEHGSMTVIDYGNGRRASVQIMPGMPFRISLQDNAGQSLHVPTLNASFFHRLVEAMLLFFDTRQVPVAKEETIQIMALIEAGRAGQDAPDQWIGVEA